MNSLLRLLRSKRGSVSASIVFVMFSALTMTAVMGMVLTTINGSSSAREYSNASASLALKKAAYQGNVIGGKAVDCSPGSDACSNAEDLGAGLKAVTLSTEVRGATVKQTNTLREVDANYIAGYDVSGNPIWVTETGTIPHKFREITSKGGFTCSIDEARKIWCWGDNINGQLGNGSTSDSYAPAPLSEPASGAQTYSKLSNGTSYSMCALTEAGQGYCWGNNSHGQLGVDPAVKQSVSAPVQMTAAGSSNKFTDIVQAATTTCAIEKGTAKIFCWGENNGDATTGGSHLGTPVAGAGQFVKLSMDRNTACGLDTGSRILCWSANGLGQVGVALDKSGAVKPAAFDGNTGMVISTAMYVPSSPVIVPAGQDKADPGTGVPVQVPGQWKDIVVGDQEQDLAKSVVCGIKTNDTVWCWGDNDFGQLGAGSTVKTDSATPVAVATDRKFKSLAISPETVCGVDTTNHVLCWGANDYGQLGNGSAVPSSSLPVEVDKNTTYQDAGLRAASGNKKWFCGLTHAVNTSVGAGKELGAVKCWGRNSFGQMANGTTTPVSTPLMVPGYGSTAELTVGDHHACVADENMVTSCWGRNTSGEAGTGLRSAGDTGFTAPAGVKEIPFVYPGFDGYVNGGRE